MPEITLAIMHEVGLHARPASAFVRRAREFTSDITVSSGNREVNAKSILGLLSLGISKGQTVIVRATGIDADRALAALQAWVEEQNSREDV
jgi:phosphotransferase system HPr (HPr) family protein